MPANNLMARKVLFLAPYPLNESPSQRFRFEQYFSILLKHGIGYSVQTFLTTKNWRIFFQPGRPVAKVVALAEGFARRVLAVYKAAGYDFIFVHREVAPLGPPIFEWIIARVLGKKIIYDFDDAIWSTDRNAEPWLLRVSKWRSKVASICRWSYKVSCGNEYLCSYASRYSNNVVYNPTTVDTDSLHNPDLHSKKQRKDDELVIGWTGSHSTLKYLQGVEHVLNQIANEFQNVSFTIIADSKPQMNLPRLSFIPWNLATEIQDLMQMDIGIMPLPDDEWSKGKCGFKLLQYMSVKVAAVASRVGVNQILITHGANGFLCTTSEEWKQSLTRLIRDSVLRENMKVSGREKVIRSYSVSSNSSNFVSLFE